MSRTIRVGPLGLAAALCAAPATGGAGRDTSYGFGRVNLLQAATE